MRINNKNFNNPVLQRLCEKNLKPDQPRTLEAVKKLP
jgi:hypothetical protein